MRTLTLVSAVIFTLLISPISSSGAGVSGRYLSASGNNIVLELAISAPAPQSIIVEQNISPSNPIKGGAPNPRKISQKTGNIKWLLTGVKPGRTRISLFLGAPMKGNIRATIRYRSPGAGKFIEFSVSP